MIDVKTAAQARAQLEQLLRKEDVKFVACDLGTQKGEFVIVLYLNPQLPRTFIIPEKAQNGTRILIKTARPASAY